MTEYFDQVEPDEFEQVGFILVPIPEDEEYGDDVRAFIDPADPIDDFVEAATTNHPNANHLLSFLAETEQNVVMLANGYFADRTFSDAEIGEIFGGVHAPTVGRVRKQAYNQMHGGIRNWYYHNRWPEQGYVAMPPKSKKIR